MDPAGEFVEAFGQNVTASEITEKVKELVAEYEKKEK